MRCEICCKRGCPTLYLHEYTALVTCRSTICIMEVATPATNPSCASRTHTVRACDLSACSDCFPSIPCGYMYVHDEGFNDMLHVHNLCMYLLGMFILFSFTSSIKSFKHTILEDNTWFHHIHLKRFPIISIN